MDLGIGSWEEFKNLCIGEKDLNCQYVDMGSAYRLVGPDVNSLNWVLDMPKGTTAAAEFEADYVHHFNKKIEIRTLPDNAFQMQADAASATITAGTTGTIDFKIQNYGDETFLVKYLAGAEIFTVNAAPGDWAESQIIDKDDVLGYGASAENPIVLKAYVLRKFLFNGVAQTILATAPGAIPVGLYIRVVYHSVGTQTNPTIFVNYDIEVKG